MPGNRVPFVPVDHDPPVDKLDDDFPIRLTTGRRLDSYNTGVQTAGYTSPLRRGESLDISPEDAEALRAGGRRGRPGRSRGAARSRCRAGSTSRCGPGLTFMTMHFQDEVAVNLLTIDATDPKSGTAEFKATAIRIEKLRADPGDRSIAAVDQRTGLPRHARAVPPRLGSGDPADRDRAVRAASSTFDCLDASGGQIDAARRSTTSAPARLLDRVDQVNGPIAVEGAEPGDTLQIDLLEFRAGRLGLDREHPGLRPARRRVPEPACASRGCPRVGGRAEFLPGIRVPVVPFCGEIGVAPVDGPALDDPARRPRRQHGHPPPDAGATLFLPVFHAGARLSASATATRPRATARSAGRRSRRRCARPSG